jgi:hypothetical protein
MQADDRDRFEKQLLDQTARAEAKLPNEIFIRMKDAYDVARNSYNDADANLQQYMGKNPDDINGIAALQKIRDDEGSNIVQLRLALAEKSKGTPWENAYNFKTPAPDGAGNVPAPAPAPAVQAPVVNVPEITLTKSSDLEQKKLEVDQQVQAGEISPVEATRRKKVLTVQAGELSRKEGAAAGAKAKAESEEQKRLGVLVGSAKTLGENSVMMGAVEKVASGNLDDLSVNAMLAALPAENARMVGGLREKDDTMLNTLRSKLGTDTEYTPEDKAALMDIAKRVQAGYNAKVDRLRQEWGKLSPAQREQVKADFSAFVPASKAVPQGVKPLSPEMKAKLGIK